jgi:hypothetical protein
MASSSSSTPSDFDEVLSLLSRITPWQQPTKKRKSAGDMPPATLEERAHHVCNGGLRQFAENMQKYNVDEVVDRKGLPFYGDEQLKLAIRPPADQQRIMLNKTKEHFVGVYSKGQVDELSRLGYTEAPGLFIPSITISSAFIAAIPSKLEAARVAAVAQSETDTGSNSIAGRLPEAPLPESWWKDWYGKRGDKKRTCSDFIWMWENGAALRTVDDRQYTLPPPKTHTTDIKDLGTTSSKMWNCCSTAYHNLTTEEKYKVAGGLDGLLPWSKVRDKRSP